MSDRPTTPMRRPLHCDCGSVATFAKGYKSSLWRVYCLSLTVNPKRCKASSAWYETQVAALAAWNRRAGEAEVTK
jgi:hypothetical protein